MLPVFILFLACASRPDAGLAKEAPPEPTKPARCSLSVGTQTITVDVDGQRRTAVVRRGSRAGETAPTLFLWHGFGASARRILPAVSADEYWDDAVVVVPEGLGRTFEKFGPVARPGWQITLGELGDRDLKLFDALLAELAPCMDRSRVYSTGFSNGGFFSNLLGCHRQEVLAGIAPVGGGGPFSDCDSPMPVMITHGTVDTTVPLSMAEGTLQAWSRVNRCVDTPRSVGTCTSLQCETAVAMCTFEGGHTWPSSTDEQIAGFLRAQERPGPP